jgi:hypothetical protein
VGRGHVLKAADDEGQGLTLVHFSAQRMHILWDTLGAIFFPGLLDRGARGGVTNTA